MTPAILVCTLGALLGLPAVLRLRRRGPTYWAATLILLATLAFGVVGCLRPWTLIQPVSLAFALGGVATLAAAPVLLAIQWVDRGPQRRLRVLHVLAPAVAAWGTSDLILRAWASV